MIHQRLSAIFIAVTAASLLMVSTAGIAAHKTHKATKVAAEQENFKGEANFKAEVPPPCPPVLMLHDGFYLGVGVGYDSYRVHSSVDSTLNSLPLSSTSLLGSSAASHNLSATGWMGGIFAGYGRYFDWFYLAAEINASTSNADSTSSFTSTDFTDGDTDSGYVKVEARTSYGIALLPGIRLNDSSLLYVRLGYLRTNFKANASFTDVDGAGVTNASLAGSSNEWRNGFNYGVGIETAIAEDVSVRGEYTHTTFNSKTVNASFTSPAGTYVANMSDKFNVSNNEFMLSLLYHFA